MLASCDCLQVALPEQARHTDTLMRQLTDWALSPAAAAGAHTAVAAAASSMQQQLRLQDQAAGLGSALEAGAGSDAGRARQQQLLQLPLNAAEEGVLAGVLRARMAAGKTGGHLLALYLLQVRLQGGVVGWRRGATVDLGSQCKPSRCRYRRVALYFTGQAAVPAWFHWPTSPVLPCVWGWGFLYQSVPPPTCSCVCAHHTVTVAVLPCALH